MNDRLYNTLRISLLVLLLIMLGPLLLLGTYASVTGYQSARPGDIAGLVMSLTLAVFVAVDIFVTVAIVRAVVRVIIRQFRSPHAALAAEPNPAAAARSIRILVVAIAAQIFFGALNSIFAFAHSPSMSHHAPGDFAAWLYILVSFVPSRLPFLLVLPLLLWKPGARTFAFAMAIPCILTLPRLVLGLSAGEIGLATGALNFAVLFLAWRATRAAGIQPAFDSILIAAVITFFYFSVIRFMLPFVARFPSS